MNNLLQTQFSDNDTTDALKISSAQKNNKVVTSVVHETHAEEPDLKYLIDLYSKQDRECWLCEGIASKISKDISISEDDTWHFTSCVLSWEHVHRNT